MYVYLRHDEKGAKSCDENWNWLDCICTHSCEQRIQYNIHARHSTSTHTFNSHEFIYRKCWTISISMHDGFTSLSQIHLHKNLIWLFIFKNNLKFHKKILIEFVWRERIQCTSISFNVTRAIVWQFTWYFRQSSLSTFPIKILCQPLSISM